jgi:hypothetical protein
MVSRVGVFETNSSSTHSLVIANAGLVFDCMPVDWMLKIGIITTSGGEFGWEWKTRSSFEDKLAYLSVRAFGQVEDMFNSGEIYCGVTQIAVDELRNVSSMCAMLSDAINEVTNCELRFINISTDDWNRIGYIDHQSWDVPDEVFDGGVEAVKRFLFCSTSYIRTGNDNSDDPDE